MSQSKNKKTIGSGWRRGPIYPWLVWSTGALLFLYSFFHRVAPSVMVADLMRDFQVGGAVLGTLSAFYFYPYAMLQVPLGMILDRWGPRRVLACAALFCGAGTAFFASADTVQMAYLGRAMIGAGASFGWIGTLTLVALWFPPHRFALLTGLTSMIGMAGAVGGQAPLAAVIAIFGWRPTLMVAAVYGVVLAGVFLAVVRDRRNPAKDGADPLQRLGLRRSLREVAATPQVWAVGLIVATVSVPVLAFAGLWGVPYMIQVHGVSNTIAAACMSVLLASWGIGAPILGWLSDRIGSRKIPLLTGAIISFAAILAVIYLPGLPFWLVVALLALNGLAGSSAVISFATARENTRVEVSGMTMGLVNLMAMGLSAVFQPLIGWLLDLNWDGLSDAGARLYSTEAYQIAFLSLAGCALVAVTAGLLMRETHCRQVVKRP